MYLGEVPGVATNSKGNVFVYTRTGNDDRHARRLARLRARRLAPLRVRSRRATFVREIGVGIYGFLFAHVVRIDSQDNIWVVDEGANMVIKFDPNGRILMTIGRKPEAINVRNYEPPAPPAGRVAAVRPRQGARVAPVRQRAAAAVSRRRHRRSSAPASRARASIVRPTSAGTPQGNIFVSDGYGNSRVVKYDKNGVFLKMAGHRGTGPLEFNTPHGLAVDAQGNVYIADRGNNRIQVLDNELNFKAQYLNVGTPWTVCVSPGPESVPLQLQLERDRQLR